jgi:hypothetical protein
LKTTLYPDEQILKTGAANLQRGIETVGGKLYLTNRRLIFEAHALNVQTGSTEIPLSDVCSLQRCWTKFLESIPLFPNSLAVLTSRGDEFRFVLL